MASDVDVCNMALSHFGSESVVTSLSPVDGSVEAGHCKRFFSLARQEALEMAPFTWTKKRALMAAVANPSRTWAYAYALPGDCLSPLRVLQQTKASEWLFGPSSSALTADALRIFTERGSADFELEGRVLLTHEPEAVLLYTRDITDLTHDSAAFISGFSYLLASYLAGPLIKGREGAAAGRELRAAARDALAAAAVQDANSSSEGSEFMPASLQVR